HNQTLAREPRGARGDSITLRIGVSLVGDLKQVLPGRVVHGRNLFLTSGDAVVEFTPGDAVSWNRTEEKLSIALPPAAAGDLASQLRPQRGRYASPLAPGLSVQVVPSPIKDRDGNVVEIIRE